MTDIPQSELDALRIAAEAATPGPWENYAGFVRSPNRGETVLLGGGGSITTSTAWVAECRDGEAFYNWEANASYIAAFNPATGLRLLDRIEELERALEHTTELLVDTWSTAMDGDPELEWGVQQARSALQSPQAQPGGGV